MKNTQKTIWFLMLAVAALGFTLFSACSEDKELEQKSPIPMNVISIEMSDDSLYVDVFQVPLPTITGRIIAAPNSLAEVKYYIVDIYDDLLDYGTVTEFPDSCEYSISVDLDYKEFMAGFKVVCTDVEGRVAEKIVRLKVVDYIRWEPEVILIPAQDTAVLTLAVVDTLPIEVRAKSDAGVSAIKYYLVEQRGLQISETLLHTKNFTVRTGVQEVCTYTSTCTPYTVAIKIAIVNGKGHVKNVDQPVRITDKNIILPQINLLSVRDTIKASLSMASKTTLQVEVFSAAGLTNISYYEHRAAGDSVLLQSKAAQGVKYAEAYVFTVSSATRGFSIVATNSEGASARLYKPAKQYSPFHIIVAKDGSGTHTTIKAAFAAIPDNSSTPTVVLIRDGVYTEWLLLPSTKKNVILVGESMDNTIIRFNAAAPNTCPADAPKCTQGTEIGTMNSATLHVEAELFYAENLTIENSAGNGAGQAVAIRVNKDKMVFVNCKFLGYQDTQYTHGDGRRYYKNCYIAGAVDFIFGNGVDYFDGCTLYCRGASGHVTAASGAKGKFNYVFNSCCIEGSAPAGSFSLGRPWKDNAHVAFINTSMTGVIKAKGWETWGTQIYKYREYGSTGAGANNTSTRGNNTADPGTFKFLTADEAAEYSLENVMRMQDNAANNVDNYHPSQLINRAEAILR